MILRLGNRKKWGVAVDYVPSEFGFEPRSPRYGPLFVWGSFNINGAQSGPFLATFGPFLGHIVEFEGKKGLFVTGRSWRM